MTNNETPNTDSAPKKRRKRSCGLCGSKDHDKRTCPKKKEEPQQNSTTITTSTNTATAEVQNIDDSTPREATVSPTPPIPSLSHSIYVVLDLETTGFSRSRCHTTIMKNRIPKELTITKTSKLFKEMSRGDFKRHCYTYKDGEDEKEVGLVCWKDRDIVYCLSNETDTISYDSCKRRSRDGLLTISRPKMIADYNKYMGGVDLADMRRLHCNSTIMGQNRWWLKLFFYLLDVGTSNALVLYKLAKGGDANLMSIVEFK